MFFMPDQTGGAIMPGCMACQLKVGGGCQMPTTPGALLLSEFHKSSVLDCSFGGVLGGGEKVNFAL